MTQQQVHTGDFEVGQPIRFSCFASKDPGAGSRGIDPEAAAVEPLEEPLAGDLVTVAATRSERGHVIARTLYMDDATQAIALSEDALSGEPGAGSQSRTDTAMTELDPGVRTRP
jgi:hypothetical protein